MARVTYEKGLKCKKCGNLIIHANRFSRCVLCQNCGAHLADLNIKELEMLVTDNANIVTVKVTHKLFKDIYEEV